MHIMHASKEVIEREREMQPWQSCLVQDLLLLIIILIEREIRFTVVPEFYADLNVLIG